MSGFSLRIIASDHVFYDGSCEILTVPAHDGPVSILAHHEAMMMATQEGEVRFRPLGSSEWQEAVVGSGGGYAAVRAKKKTFTRDGGSGEPYAVGYVTNSIENGHKQAKGRYVPALGKKLVADRVAGKGAYLAARQRAEEIAYQAAERFARKIQAKLQEG